ncbi:hypothetical protein B0T24DRAFT_122176 [Lasiosphaeria ovina]|uniref:Uncharacterized protein n=1 Tax=Lasiosphaeria ovina TaxID=92902 RepID=A0AAE0JSN0_9PEZI|nr:hypothetical protein B0T24DRAFT_122176 [Lasiosphaeria ovina]
MDILKSGTFVKRVAAAMRHMPRAESLYIRPSVPYWQYYRTERCNFETIRRGAENNVAVDYYATMGTNRRIERDEDDSIDPERYVPLQAIYMDLPRALHKEGVFLANLYIRLTFGDWILGKLSPTMIQGIRGGLQNLKRLSFSADGFPISARSDVLEDQSDAACSLLRAYMDTDTLETLEFGDFGGVLNYHFPADELASARCWPNLRILYPAPRWYGIRDRGPKTYHTEAFKATVVNFASHIQCLRQPLGRVVGRPARHKRRGGYYAKSFGLRQNEEPREGLQAQEVNGQITGPAILQGED